MKAQISGIDITTDRDCFSFEGGKLETPLEARTLAGALLAWAKTAEENEKHREAQNLASVFMGPADTPH